MAQMFFRQARAAEAAEASGPVAAQHDGQSDGSQAARIPPDRPLDRPSTAPARRRNATDTSLTKGRVRLFRSDFLNNHPVMLEYISRGVVGTPHETRASVIESACHPADASAKAKDNAAPRQRSSFARRLARECELAGSASSHGRVDADTARRKPAATAHGPAPATTAAAAPATTSNSESDVERAGRVAASSGRVATSSGRVAASSAPEDLSDPNTMIRKLLHTVDTLRLRIDELEQKGTLPEGVATASELAQENRALQAECANLYTLQEENKALRAELDKARRSSGGGSGRSSQHSQQSLEAENEHLRHRVQELANENQRLLMKGGGGIVFLRAQRYSLHSLRCCGVLHPRG